MRKAAIVAAAVLAFIIVALLVIPWFIDLNQYRAQVETQMQNALGRRVSVGEMRLRLLLPKVRIANVVIGEDPSFGSGTFASAPEVVASVDVGALLGGNVKLSSVVLEQPTVELTRNSAGVWNVASLGKKPAQPAPEAKPSAGAAAGGQQGPSAKPEGEESASAPISNLEISKGRVNLTDHKTNFRGSYNNIDLSVEDYSPNQPFEVNAAMTLPGAGEERLSLDARVGPIRENQMLATPVDGEVELEEVSLASLQALANSTAFPMQGIASGSLKLKNTGRMFESSGDLKLENAQVRTVQVGYPITLEYKASGNLDEQIFKVEDGKLRLGSTPFSIAGTVNTAPSPMQVDLRFTTKDASLGETARLASAFGVAFAAGMDVSGKLNADVHAKGPLAQPSLEGSVDARDISVRGGGLKQSVESPELQLTLSPAAIRSNPFTVTSNGTRIQGQLTLTNYSSPAPQVDATIRTSNAQIGELIAMAQAYGLTAAQGMSGSGQASLDLRATGPLKNANALSLNGTGQISNASLGTPSLTQPLKLSRADLRFTQNSAVAQNLSASLAGTNASGNLSVSNFAAPKVQFTLRADQINVPEIQKAIVTAPGGTQPAKKASLRIIPEANAQKPAEPSFLTTMTGSGSLAVGKILYDKLVLSNVRSDVQLDHGVIRLTPLTASVFGGQQTGAITVDTRSSPMDIRMQTRLQQVQANDLLSAVTSLNQTVYGLLAGNANAEFSTVQSTSIASTLNGRMSLNLKNGRIAGIDLLNRLSQVAQFATGVQTPGNFTNVASLTGDFDVNRGVAQTNNLRAEIPGGTLAADGAVNLVNSTLSMHVTAVLSKEMSQRAGGSKVGGFMSTALANNQGELVVPVVITGTFQNPSVSPDVQKIAQMKLKNLLPTSGNPGSLTSGILGAVLGGNDQNGQSSKGGLSGIVGAITGQQQAPQKNAKQPEAKQAPTQEQKKQRPSNPLGDALNSIFGNKGQQQQKQEPQKP